MLFETVTENCTVNKLRHDSIGYDVDPIFSHHCEIWKSGALSRHVTKGAARYYLSLVTSLDDNLELVLLTKLLTIKFLKNKPYLLIC